MTANNDTVQEFVRAEREFLNFERRMFDEFDLPQRLILKRIREYQSGYAEMALHIENLESRKKYCDLAIELIRASIRHYRPATTSMDRPIHSHQTIINTAIPITLIVAGVVLHLLGPAIALITAGISYWFTAKIAGLVVHTSMSRWRNHNAGVSGWKEQIKEWEEEESRLLKVNCLPQL